MGAANRPAEKIHDKIYVVSGFGNTYMVLTDAGNVIIDTSLAEMANRHHKVLTEISKAPTRYIIFTHAHEDHTSGAGLWKEAETQVVAQRQFVEMRQYQDRFGEFFARRNAAQFGFDEERAARQPAIGGSASSRASSSTKNMNSSWAGQNFNCSTRPARPTTT